MKYLGISEEKLISTNSYNTAKEIDSQILIWEKAVENFEKNKEAIDLFLKVVDDNTQVVFSGAGTSEYIGNILVPILNSMQTNEFKSLATTDVVNNPLAYIKKNKKTLLVSFARSGDSPESVATVELFDKLCENGIYHLFITCNENGQLAKLAKTDEFKDRTLVLMMPEGSNDKGFAMTSSFSSMLMTALLTFNKNTTAQTVREAIKLAQFEKEDKLELIKSIAKQDHERIIVLGDGPFRGLAEELTLKVMELTAGKVVAKSDTTLGFRHGPKSIINNKTIVFSMLSNDEYAKKYALDILSEMTLENVADNIVCYSLVENENLKNSVKTLVTSKTSESLEKAIFSYLIYGQMYAFFKSQHFGLTTDNPFPSGEVNRVVKKFQIHQFVEKGE